MIEDVLKCEPSVKRVAREFMSAQDFLFLGRGPMHPVALEGALKLKEISYIHAEGYAGGEMKHGPIALIDEKMPVVVIAPKQPHVAYEKIIGNIEEVRARGGKVIAVIDEDDAHVASLADHVIRDPGRQRAARAGAGHDPAAAARLPRGRPARERRGPAAQPRQERDGGVVRRSRTAARSITPGDAFRGARAFCY